MEAAASIIAFVQATAGIAKCIKKTRQLWREVKDLPEEINETIANLELLGPMLQDVQDQFNSHDIPQAFWNDVSALRTLELSKQAHKMLKDLVSDFDAHLSRKRGFRGKVTATRFVFKKEAVASLEKKLDRSVKLVEMSMHSFSMAWMRFSPQIIAKQVTTDVLANLPGPGPSIKQIEAHILGILPSPAPPQQQVDNHDGTTFQEDEVIKDDQIVKHSNRSIKTVKPNDKPRFGRFAFSYSRDTGAWYAFIQWPRWMSQRIYEVQSGPTYAGWTYNWRTYNIVSTKSPVFVKANAGDKDGMLELFRTRKASPFDRDDNGSSLLEHATRSRQYDICQLLLSIGLQDLIDDKPDPSHFSGPLSILIRKPDRSEVEPEWQRIIDLFHSYLQEPEISLMPRIFDCYITDGYGERLIEIYRERIMPKYYTSPLYNRVEAVRLGCFDGPEADTLMSLLTADKEPTQSDVSLSCRAKLSLVHSAAIAFGIRFPDKAIPKRRGLFPLPIFNIYWNGFVIAIVSKATTEDLHSIETVTPWDFYHAPTWRGTALVSMLGAALCYLSPDISFYYWDTVFQSTLRQWLKILQKAGVDLWEYGRNESRLLQAASRGALDADAVEAARHEVRHRPSGEMNLRVRLRELEEWNHNHWVPIRLIHLRTGRNPEDWQIVWAPEFEHMACQFWKLVERESIVMPGSWVD